MSGGENRKGMAMKMPNGENAIVDVRKVRDYCLSLTHPRGRHKARVFESALGVTKANFEDLCNALKKAARDVHATPGVSDRYGSRYIIDFEFELNEKAATIRSCWIILETEAAPRFVTCFVL